MKSSEFIEWQEIVYRMIYRLLYTMNEEELLNFLTELNYSLLDHIANLQGPKKPYEENTNG